MARIWRRFRKDEYVDEIFIYWELSKIYIDLYRQQVVFLYTEFLFVNVVQKTRKCYNFFSSFFFSFIFFFGGCIIFCLIYLQLLPELARLEQEGLFFFENELANSSPSHTRNKQLSQQATLATLATLATFQSLDLGMKEKIILFGLLFGQYDFLLFLQ